MRVLLWLFCGLAAAAIAALLQRDRDGRSALVLAVVGAAGALAGGFAGSLVTTVSSPTEGGSFLAATAGAMVAVACYFALRHGEGLDHRAAP